MKSLPIKSENLQYIEQSFKEWLDILGYSYFGVYSMPILIRELFHYLEQRNITVVTQITTHEIKNYYEYLKHRTNIRTGGALSNSYLNKHLQALYKFMDYLRQSGRLVLPYLEIKREELNTKPITILSIEEIKELYLATHEHDPNAKYEAIASRDRAMLTIFYSCGLRRNEGWHLNLSDINFDRSVLHVRKGKNYTERFVPFNKNCLQYLQEYIYDHRQYFNLSKYTDALFVSIQSKRMSGLNMSLRLKLLQQRTDNIDLKQKNITLHALRHSIATHFLQAGMQLEKISRFLGHSSLESTQIYTHLVTPEGMPSVH